MQSGIILVGIIIAALFFFGRESAEARRNREEYQRNRKEEEAARHQEEEARTRRADAIGRARDKTETLVKRGAIFEITTTSDIRGYHVKELGWVKCECDERSDAESRLRMMAADKYQAANALTKLSYSIRDESYQAGTGPNGNPYFRNRKVKTWEAMACEAILNQHVDKSAIRWEERMAVIDGSNVAHWANQESASLDAVKAIILFLKRESATPIVVFDANIGFKVAGKHMDADDLVNALGGDIEVELVHAGTIADRRIVEIAEQRKAVIVSNDLFRDSLLARPIPKRRGFYLAEYDYAELSDPRA